MSFKPDEQKDRVAAERPLSRPVIDFAHQRIVEEDCKANNVAQSTFIDNEPPYPNIDPEHTMLLLKNVVYNGSFNGRSFESLCCELIALHEKKNADYGGAFYRTMNTFGITALLIRLDDKLSRLMSIVKNEKQEVTDESIEDTLRDLASYAIMGLEHLYNTPQP